MRPLPPLQFPLDRLADEVCPALPVLKNPVNPGQRAVRESGGSLFVIYLCAAHFVDITY